MQVLRAGIFALLLVGCCLLKCRIWLHVDAHLGRDDALQVIPNNPLLLLNLLPLSVAVITNSRQRSTSRVSPVVLQASDSLEVAIGHG